MRKIIKIIKFNKLFIKILDRIKGKYIDKVLKKNQRSRIALLILRQEKIL